MARKLVRNVAVAPLSSGDPQGHTQGEADERGERTMSVPRTAHSTHQLELRQSMRMNAPSSKVRDKAEGDCEEEDVDVRVEEEVLEGLEEARLVVDAAQCCA